MNNASFYKLIFPQTFWSSTLISLSFLRLNVEENIARQNKVPRFKYILVPKQLEKLLYPTSFNVTVLFPLQQSDRKHILTGAGAWIVLFPRQFLRIQRVMCQSSASLPLAEGPHEQSFRFHTRCHWLLTSAHYVPNGSFL